LFSCFNFCIQYNFYFPRLFLSPLSLCFLLFQFLNSAGLFRSS
jgi:hypothetical protein